MRRQGGAVRQYGKTSKRSTAERMFSELPQTPVRKPKRDAPTLEDPVECITEQLSSVQIEDSPKPRRTSPRKSVHRHSLLTATIPSVISEDAQSRTRASGKQAPSNAVRKSILPAQISQPDPADENALRVISWDEVCPPGDRIVKIAEASYAEVYRVSNERGTSIIKVIRLDSPIKALTKHQIKARLVDELPHSEDDLRGELQISEWLADIPGFVVYKERYIVQGKATRELLDTHQAFQRRIKRKDPGRAQFYPSPSRYLKDTQFLVVELGDAGTPLEDWEIGNEDELWDIFFLEAIALARAEDLAMFEHRDLHEGNLCIRRNDPRKKRTASSEGFFGYSGLDITILDYGLSRAEDLSIDFAEPVCHDMEKDLSFFTSTHASQCRVYRQMRSFLLRADRTCLPPEEHNEPYAKGIDGPLSWQAYAPYTNVLWLAYLYDYLVTHFAGDSKKLAQFKKQTREMWKYLDPDAGGDVPCFGSAAEVVCFAVEAGWVREEQLTGAEASFVEREDSIIISRDECWEDASVRRSPRRRQSTMVT